MVLWILVIQIGVAKVIVSHFLHEAGNMILQGFEAGNVWTGLQVLSDDRVGRVENLAICLQVLTDDRIARVKYLVPDNVNKDDDDDFQRFVVFWMFLLQKRPNWDHCHR